MAAKLFRLTETYHLNAGAEQAQTTLWWLSPTGLDIDLLAGEMASYMSSRWDAQRSLHSPSTTHDHAQLDQVRVTDGRTELTRNLDPVANPPGTGSTNTMPTEVAEVLTLRSAFAGARARGRIYLPPFSISGLNVDGRMTTVDQHQAVDAYTSFFDAVIDDPQDCEPVIYSRVDRSAYRVARIDMGNVFDVQRRRRRSLVEVRYTQTLH